jgi:hypothetical protein
VATRSAVEALLADGLRLSEIAAAGAGGVRAKGGGVGVAVTAGIEAGATGPGTEEELGAVHLEAAPVRVVGGLLRRYRVVALRAYGLRHERVPAVRFDYDARSLGDRAAARFVAANARHHTVLDEDLVDGEPLAELGARRGGRPDEELVEHGPTRAERGHALRRPGRAGDHDRSHVVGVRRHRRTARRPELLQHAPPLQRRDARRVDEMGRHHVARERRPVDQQHVVAVAREQHPGRRPSAARPDDDHVVGLAHLGLSS